MAKSGAETEVTHVDLMLQQWKEPTTINKYVLQTEFCLMENRVFFIYKKLEGWIWGWGGGGGGGGGRGWYGGGCSFLMDST